MGSAGDFLVPEFDPQRVQQTRCVAEGAGASVYRGTLHGKDKPVEVAIRKPRITSLLALERFEAELSIRSRLKHPNVLPLLAACTAPPHYCTVSPWMHGGDVFDLVHAKTVRFSFTRLLRLALQLANAMAYLHECNVVHRDLKTANFLLDATWENLLIADLDLAIDVYALRSAAAKNGGRAVHRGPSNGRLAHMVGTLVYMAPEVLCGAPHSFEADVYAFAIAINEMAACAVPYVDRKLPVPELHTVLETRFNEVTLRSAIVKGHLRPVLASGVPPQFSALIARAWHPEPSMRPTFVEIVAELKAIEALGSTFLDRFGAATLDIDEHLAGESRQLNLEDRTLLAEKLRAFAKNPVPPVWRSFADNNARGESEMDIDGNLQRRYRPVVAAALSSTSGNRGADRMEDRSLVLPNLAGLNNVHLFAVFDGHGGQACSQFAEDHLPGAIIQAWRNVDSTPDSALVHAFENTDRAFLMSSSFSEESGSTALAALIVDSTLYVANAGDCRCVLGKRNGEAVALSRDHVPTDPAEKARVLARGGSLSASGRIEGRLAVSRALGDRSVKQYVAATPEVSSVTLGPIDEFIILASDGLWDVVSPKLAVELVQKTVRVPDMAAKRLALKAIELGSDDNISVIVCFLSSVSSFSSV